ncbi:hypothetical protein MPSEU_000341700 [Mayamaea pseudoterrestris]|nr:hypothetical protein MPSEU_000341700 [Mayamaea pseudoterrestris]
MAATYFAADVILDWSGSLEPQAFFRSTRAAAGASDNRDTIGLNMDGRFLGAFSRLPDAAADEVLATIKRNPITTIYVGTFPLPNNHRGVASDNAYISRLVLLFCCLKSLRSIKNVFLDATPKEGIEHAMTLQYLRNAQNLTLMGQFGYQVTSEVFASFKMLTKLHHVKIHLAGDCLGFLQPLLCTRSPYLLHLSLIKVASAGPVTLNDAQSLFSILACGKILIVEIENFELSGENVCRIFCDGVAQAKMHVFDLKNCVVHDPIHFAHALSVSQVTVTSLYEVMFALERTKLNTCIKSSKDFEKNPRRKCAASPNSHVLAHLVGNLSRSVLFDSLGVTTELYAADLDEALAFCVTNRPDIDKFEVSCSAILPTQPGYKSPALLDAMRTNYGLRNCTFTSPPIWNDSLKDPWDPDFKQEVAMYCRLNNSGRGYLALTRRTSTRDPQF